MTDAAEHGFTPDQVNWLDRRFGAGPHLVGQGFDRSTIMWMVGGLVATGITAAGGLYVVLGDRIDSVRTEVQSVRTEVQSVRTEIQSVRGEIRENRAAIAELARGQARIEVILEERLLRDR